MSLRTWDGPQWKTGVKTSKRARAKRTRRLTREERGEKGKVRARDQHCRFPLCGCGRVGGMKAIPTVSHQRHKGMGGNPTGDRSTAAGMILLCKWRHQDAPLSRDKGTLRYVPLTDAGCNGPVAWEQFVPGGWTEIARESDVNVLLPLTDAQRELLRDLAGMGAVMADQNQFDFDRKPEKAEVYARAGDPATSHKSMAQMDLDKVQGAAALCLYLFKTYGAMADYEYLERFKIEWEGSCDTSLYRQARNQCRNQGLIRATKLVRKSPITGRDQTVWEACEQAPPERQKCPTCGHVTRVNAVTQEGRRAMRNDEAGWHPRTVDGKTTLRRHHASRQGKHEERIMIGNAHAVHILQDAEDPAAAEWVVWLNTEASDFDGLVLGIGKTRQEAVQQATEVAAALEEFLQGPPPSALSQAEAISRAMTAGVVSAKISTGVDMASGEDRTVSFTGPCTPTKRYIRYHDSEWQESDDTKGPWTRVAVQRESLRVQRQGRSHPTT